MAKKWDSATTINFVRQYAKQTCLWDIGHPNYKNRAARDAAVQDIVRNMNMRDLRPNDVKCKIRIIRNTYINEIKKMREKKNVIGKQANYICSIPWFETADKFLRKVVRKKKYPASLVSLDDGDSIDLEYGSAAASGSNEAEAESLQYQPDVRIFHQNYPSDSDSELTMDLNPVKRIKQELEVTSEDEMSLLSAERGSPVTITTTPSLTLPVPYSETETLSPSTYSYSNTSNCDSPNLGLPSSMTGTRKSSSCGLRSSFRTNTCKPTPPPLISSTNDVMENQSQTDLNEFDVFAKNVALQLKQLPLENALKVQARIHDILIVERLNVIQLSKRNESAVRHKEDDESFEHS